MSRGNAGTAFQGAFETLTNLDFRLADNWSQNKTVATRATADWIFLAYFS